MGKKERSAMSKNKYRSRDYHAYWETVKTLPTLQAKWEYTWENWNILIITVAILLVFVITMGISIYNNSAPVYLNGEFINIISTDQVSDYQADYLEQAFLREYLGIPKDDRTIITYASDLMLDLSGSDESASTNYNTMTLLDVHMAAHEIDYFLLADSLVDFLDECYEAFVDLREFLTEEELELYADRLRYTEAGVPVAIDISDTELVQKLGLVSADPICLAWCVYIEDATHMRPFFDFIMRSVAQ